jgi:exopolysaccharide production repressor protein
MAKGGSGWVNHRFLPGRVNGLSGMSLPKFIVGMMFALAIVVAWSYLGGASLGTTLFRVIACAIVIQLGYFLLVFVMVARNAPKSADRIRNAERKLSSTEAADGEKFSARRSPH